MIVVTSGTTMVHGTKIELQVEFTCLVNHLLRERDGGKPIMTKEDLDYCVSLASMTDDEIHKEMENAVKDTFCTPDLDWLFNLGNTK